MSVGEGRERDHLGDEPVDLLLPGGRVIDLLCLGVERAQRADRGPLVVNPVIYAEVSAGFERIEDVEAALPEDYYVRQPLPWEAAFLAGRSFVRYRRRGGQRRSPLPDFYIGAHATIRGLTLLTRDARRYRSYFPKLPIISP